MGHEVNFGNMDKVQKQRGSTVPHKATRDGVDYIRIEYAEHRVYVCHFFATYQSGHNDIKTVAIYLHVSSAYNPQNPNPLDLLDDP